MCVYFWTMLFIANRYDIDVVIRHFCKIRCQTIGISIQYQANEVSAAVTNNFRHILIKVYIPFI